MQIRVDHIGDDLKALVMNKVIEISTKEGITIEKATNRFAVECDIQTQRMSLWLAKQVGFHEDTLDKIGKQLIKEL